VLAILGASAGAFAYYRDLTTVPTPSSARWFSDGPHWTVSTADGKTQALTSQVSTTGTEPLATLGLSANNAVIAEMDDHRESLMWTTVTALLFPNGNHLTLPEVYVASDDGVTQMVGFAGVLLPAVFEPGLPVLPAEADRGDTWSERGIATWHSQRMASYRLDASIEAVGAGGCVDVRTRLRLTMTKVGASIGGTDSDDTSTSTYCPGRWLTAVDGDLDSQSVTVQVAERTLAGFTAPVVADLDASPEVETVLFPRAFGSSASADLLVLPEAGVVVDADEDSSSVSGYIMDAAYPTPQWTVLGRGPFLANPVGADRHHRRDGGEGEDRARHGAAPVANGGVDPDPLRPRPAGGARGAHSSRGGALA
jgi:hypothetical protein